MTSQKKCCGEFTKKEILDYYRVKDPSIDENEKIACPTCEISTMIFNSKDIGAEVEFAANAGIEGITDMIYFCWDEIYEKIISFSHSNFGIAVILSEDDKNLPKVCEIEKGKTFRLYLPRDIVKCLISARDEIDEKAEILFVIINPMKKFFCSKIVKDKVNGLCKDINCNSEESLCLKKDSSWEDLKMTFASSNAIEYNCTILAKKPHYTYSVASTKLKPEGLTLYEDLFKQFRSLEKKFRKENYKSSKIMLICHETKKPVFSALIIFYTGKNGERIGEIKSIWMDLLSHGYGAQIGLNLCTEIAKKMLCHYLIYVCNEEITTLQIFLGYGFLAASSEIQNDFFKYCVDETAASSFLFNKPKKTPLNMVLGREYNPDSTKKNSPTKNGKIMGIFEKIRNIIADVDLESQKNEEFCHPFANRTKNGICLFQKILG